MLVCPGAIHTPLTDRSGRLLQVDLEIPTIAVSDAALTDDRTDGYPRKLVSIEPKRHYHKITVMSTSVPPVNETKRL